jgi:hypothetical protein
MNIYACDKCEAAIEIEDATHITLGHIWQRVELCPDCAKPIAEILKNYEILKDSWIKTLQASKKAV